MTYLKIKIQEMAGKLGLRTPASRISVQLEKPQQPEKPKLKVVKDEN